MKKTILLTGGTGLFGRTLVKYFLENEFNVITTSRTESNLKSLYESNSKYKDSLIGIVCDFTSENYINDLLEILVSKEIKINHLINNARSISNLEVQDDGITNSKDFLEEFSMDVVIPYELTMALSMSLDHPLTTVVNIGSMYGEIAPNPVLYKGDLSKSPVQYGVSKAALHHLTRELAVRLAPNKIRVNCVAFGGVEGRASNDFKEIYRTLVPSKKMLQVEDVIGPVEFLISKKSSSINGHVLIADDGWTIW